MLILRMGKQIANRPAFNCNFELINFRAKWCTGNINKVTLLHRPPERGGNYISIFYKVVLVSPKSTSNNKQTISIWDLCL